MSLFHWYIINNISVFLLDILSFHIRYLMQHVNPYEAEH